MPNVVTNAARHGSIAVLDSSVLMCRNLTMPNSQHKENTNLKNGQQNTASTQNMFTLTTAHLRLKITTNRLQPCCCSTKSFSSWTSRLLQKMILFACPHHASPTKVCQHLLDCVQSFHSLHLLSMQQSHDGAPCSHPLFTACRGSHARKGFSASRS